MKTGISVLIFIGLFIWLGNLQILNFSRDWPLILIFLGVITLFSAFKKRKRYKIISDLEKGKISAREAEKRLRDTTSHP